MVLAVVPALALALSVAYAWVGFRDDVFARIESVARHSDSAISKSSELNIRLDAYHAERAIWIQRIIDLEARNGAVQDRINLLSERLIRCERESGR
jgi:vancomycin permeability regulator SanA